MQDYSVPLYYKVLFHLKGNSTTLNLNCLKCARIEQKSSGGECQECYFCKPIFLMQVRNAINVNTMTLTMLETDIQYKSRKAGGRQMNRLWSQSD